MCIDTVESGIMTKDLAACIHGESVSSEHYVQTEDFLRAISSKLAEKMGVVVH